jgi:hypothetical protein
MCLVHVGGGEVAIIGGNQRNAASIGQGDQARFNGGFDRQAVAVQFLDNAAGEGFA